MHRPPAAHTPNEYEPEKWHDLKDHLEAVAEKAKEFASKFGAGELGYWAGLLHDIGKYNKDFQTYLNRCHQAKLKGLPRPAKGSAPHAIHGAVLARSIYADIYPKLDKTAQGGELAWVIAAHHGGLNTLSVLEGSLKQKGESPEIVEIIKGAFSYLADLQELLRKKPSLPEFAQNREQEFFIRMLLSALVDADHLNTEAWRDPRKHEHRKQVFPSISELHTIVQKDQDGIISKAESTFVNQSRREIYEVALNKASESPGFFKLTVPTGGGKTRTALSFALKHAVDHSEHGFERVIFAIPYTNVIEQTADVFRKILGPDNVLEHHSALEIVENEEKDVENWAKLATENWDAPIIVTTTVQLFESLFSNRPSKVRKIHNLTRSVIVLDEAQTLPIPLLNPILDALSELIQPRYGASVILCTATQPALDESLGFPALANVREIAPDPTRYFQTLARVHYEVYLDEPWNWTRVADEMTKVKQVLCVLNTKSQARDLFKKLDDLNAFHLSTSMYPAHRRAVLQTINKRLETHKPCQVVSTQLVEAGVDLDFPLVLRALGPLDSIVQAAGRCNREGKILEGGRVIVFKPVEHKLSRGVYKSATLETEEFLKQGVDLNDTDVFQKYFQKLYHKLVNRDEKGIQSLRQRFDYQPVAEKFRLIEDNTEPAIVRKCAPEKIDKILKDGLSRDTLRALQPYMINIFRNKTDELFRQGFIREITPGLWEWIGDYDEKLGVLERMDVDNSVQ